MEFFLLLFLVLVPVRVFFRPRAMQNERFLTQLLQILSNIVYFVLAEQTNWKNILASAYLTIHKFELSAGSTDISKMR